MRRADVAVAGRSRTWPLSRRPGAPPRAGAGTWDDGVQPSISRMSPARGPFADSSGVNSTRWPSRNSSNTAPRTELRWKKCSVPPSSRMNPKPLSMSRRAMVPVGIPVSSDQRSPGEHPWGCLQLRRRGRNLAKQPRTLSEKYRRLPQVPAPNAVKPIARRPAADGRRAAPLRLEIRQSVGELPARSQVCSERYGLFVTRPWRARPGAWPRRRPRAGRRRWTRNAVRTAGTPRTGRAAMRRPGPGLSSPSARRTAGTQSSGR